MELPTPLIGNKAHQPRKFQFSQRAPAFQQQWFDRWSCLHYDEDQVDITNHFSIQIHIINYIANSLTYTYVYCA